MPRIKIAPASQIDGMYELDGRPGVCEYATARINAEGCLGWPGDTHVTLMDDDGDAIVSGFVRANELCHD